MGKLHDEFYQLKACSEQICSQPHKTADMTITIWRFFDI